MAILVTIIIGFIIGLVARFIMPGNDAKGFVLTTVVGIVGAVIATYIGQAIGWYQYGEPAGFFASVLGAIVLLGVLRLAQGRKI